MKDAACPTPRRFLVVNPNAIVSEDIREILQGFGDPVVEVHFSMAQFGAGSFDAAFLSAPIADVLADERVALMRVGGTKIIILDGDTPEHVYSDTGLYHLSQPFRTEDVLSVLDEAGIRRTAFSAESAHARAKQGEPRGRPRR